MASETQRKVPMKLPMVGLLLGFLIGSVVAWVTLNHVLESEAVLQILFWRQVGYLIPIFVGGGTCGIIQPWKQGRAAEIARCLRRLLRSALWLFVSEAAPVALLPEYELGRAPLTRAVGLVHSSRISVQSTFGGAERITPTLAIGILRFGYQP